jgi:glycosyltransferase involved in cell wall biosynthesis
MSRTAVLVSSPPRPGLAAAIAAGEAPRRDYFELRDRLNATLHTPPAAPGRSYRLAQRVGGHALAMALQAWAQRGSYDVILTDQEAAGLILGLLFKFTGTRRGHVMISHYLSPGKKQPFFRVLRVQTHIDRTICYSSAQQQVALRKLGLRPDQVALVLHPADSAFWRPAHSAEEAVRDAELLREAGLDLPPDVPVIASAGLEFRDYQTLINAVPQLPPETRVVIAAASPWSKRKNTAEDVPLPGNVQRVSLKPLQLRALYRRARAVALPLFDVDFQAGSLVAYEALACGTPVVITRTRGQLDIVEEGVTGLYVPPGDAPAMAVALNRLLALPALAAGMGRQARAVVEDHLNLDTYLREMVQVVEDVRAARGQGATAGGARNPATPPQRRTG